MTADEQNLLQRFLQDLALTRPGPKDAEAESMILQTLRTAPDAAYVLVQHAILSDQALHAAQDRVAQLEAELNRLQGAAPAPRFLTGASPWAQAAAPDQYAAASTPPPSPPPASPPYYGPGPFQSGGGLGSFLRNVGTMAAGVAAGDLLFSGVSSLFGGGRGFGGFGGGPTEIVENNYYDDQGQGAGFGGGDFGGGSYGN